MRPLLLTLALAAGCSSEPVTPPADLSATRDLAVAADLPPSPDLAPQPDLWACSKDPDCGGATPRCDVASGRCVACLPVNDNCPNGRICKAINGVYECTCGCKLDADCGAFHCCACLCVDFAQDDRNCGGCGIACDMNQTCKNGICG